MLVFWYKEKPKTSCPLNLSHEPRLRPLTEQHSQALWKVFAPQTRARRWELCRVRVPGDTLCSQPRSCSPEMPACPRRQRLPFAERCAKQSCGGLRSF